MTLTPNQQKRPHQLVSDADRKSYIERSFARNMPDEISYWVGTTHVEDTLHHPLKGPELAKSIMEGVRRGLDVSWVKMLQNHPSSDVQSVARSSAWLSEWQDFGRLDLVEAGVVDWGMNPLAFVGREGPVWCGVLQKAITTPGLPDPQTLNLLHTWWNTFQANVKDERCESLIHKMTHSMMSRLYYRVDDTGVAWIPHLTKWRNDLLQRKGLALSSTMKNHVSGMFIEVNDLPKASHDAIGEWTAALVQHGGGLNAEDTAALVRFDFGPAIVLQDWRAGRSSPWAVEDLGRRASAFSGAGGGKRPEASVLTYLEPYISADPLKSSEPISRWLEIARDYMVTHAHDDAPGFWWSERMQEALKTITRAGGSAQNIDDNARLVAGWWNLAQRVKTGYSPNGAGAAEIIDRTVPHTADDLARWCQKLDDIVQGGAVQLLGMLRHAKQDGLRGIPLEFVAGQRAEAGDLKNYLHDKMSENPNAWRRVMWDRVCAGVGAGVPAESVREVFGHHQGVLGDPELSHVNMLFGRYEWLMGMALLDFVPPLTDSNQIGALVQRVTQGVEWSLRRPSTENIGWNMWRGGIGRIIQLGVPVEAFASTVVVVTEEQQVDDLMRMGVTIEHIMQSPDCQQKKYPMKAYVQKIVRAEKERQSLMDAVAVGVDGYRKSHKM